MRRSTRGHGDPPLDVGPSVAPSRRRPRIWLVCGIALILAGFGTFGYVGWQYEGTNYVSHRKQRAAVEAIHEEWRAGHETAQIKPGRVSSIVRIPRFGDDYEIPLLEGTSDEELATGFGHFTDSADPGAVGNFALVAHRITHGEPLRRMPELQPGDEIIVETQKTTYTYVLDTGGDDLVVPFTEVWVVDPLPTNPTGGVEPAQVAGQRLISLTTCAELFHTDERMVAFGHLVAARPRS